MYYREFEVGDIITIHELDGSIKKLMVTSVEKKNPDGNDYENNDVVLHDEDGRIADCRCMSLKMI